MIILLAGEPGKGKTFHALRWSEPVEVWDLEDRDKAPEGRMVTVRRIKVLTAGYTQDYKESLANLRAAASAWLMNPEPPTLVIDTVSDIRKPYCFEEWMTAHTGRRNPMPEEWREINDAVRAIVNPLMNRARKEGIDFIMIAQMCDQYGKVYDDRVKKDVSAKVGRERNVENWQEYETDVNVDLYVENHKGDVAFIARCDKSPVGCWTEDVTGLSLYDVLVEMGLW